MSKKYTVLLSELEELLPTLSATEQAKVAHFLRKNNVKKAKDDFYVFLRLIAPLIIPDKFQDGRHLKLFANELELIEKAVVKSEKEKLQISLPPGSMKTLTCCLFVAWVLGRHPEWFILHLGHTASFAKETFGQRIKDIIMLPEYREIFPETKISKTTKAKDLWKTTKGGTYHATGVGNAIAGKRAHILLTDDALSEQTAESKLERTKINNWYIPGARSRLLPNGSEIMVATRWHLNDLNGYIQRIDKEGKQKPWKTVVIPAILEGEQGKKAAALLDIPEGESFWPEYWPLENFQNTKATASPSTWNALYMQNPTSEQGSILKKKHFQRYDTFENKGFPKTDYIIISMDTAFSAKEKADFSCWGVWGIFGRHVYDIEGKETKVSGMMLMDCGKERYTYPELVECLQRLNAEYSPRYIVIENKASGQSLIQDMILQGLPVMPYNPDKGKEDRAHACVPFLEAGIIWVPEHEIWAKDFIDECIQFPHGEHDDQVDQFTQAVLFMRDQFLIKRPEYVASKWEDDDDDKEAYKPRQTYWRATIGRRR